LLAIWLALPWPVLVRRSRSMRFTVLFFGNLLAVLHTAFGIAALSFIATRSELTNASTLIAFNCAVAALLSMGVAACLPKSRRPIRISTLGPAPTLEFSQRLTETEERSSNYLERFLQKKKKAENKLWRVPEKAHSFVHRLRRLASRSEAPNAGS